MSEPILEIDNLHIHFETEEGTAKVINGVDLTLYQGQTAALVGETGCGKSVTSRAIFGLLSENATIPRGEIRFKGQDMLSLSEKELHKYRGAEISMIMQDPMTSLNPVFTIGEQMMDLLKYRDGFSIPKYIKRKFQSSQEEKELILDMLDEVQIGAPERVFNSYPVELSGGMRQRVLIAMALLSEPDFLIADEPGTALDVTTEEKILDLMDELIEEIGTSVLYITHDLGVARAVSDYINVMYAGEIVEKAPTKDLFTAPEHPYTRGLLDSIPKLPEGMGEGIEGYLPDYTSPPPACRFEPRCPYSEAACSEVFPYPRETNEDHHVSCHLYTGPPSKERFTEEAKRNVDIGEPPWHSSTETAASLNTLTPHSQSAGDDSDA